MRRLASTTLELSARAFARLSRLSRALARAVEDADRQRRLVVRSTEYDMMLSPNESYYADQYWLGIQRHLERVSSSATILDLGCGQGRLSMRMARAFPSGGVLACDASSSAIQAARQYAAAASMANVEFRVSAIRECLDSLASDSVDVVVMTEVTFYYPGWKDDLARIARVMRPGGTLILSSRSQYFDALCLVRDGLWEDTETLIRDREGRIFGPSLTFTWQTAAELRDLLERGHGFEVLDIRGLGVCSGIPGDPHATICEPSRLTDVERDRLMRLEVELGPTVPDAGRYIVAIARKPRGETPSRSKSS